MNYRVKIKKITVRQFLLCCLGGVASIQLLEIGGITVFNFFLIISTGYFLVNTSRMKLDSYVLLTCMASITTLVFSLLLNRFTSGFYKASIIGTISYIMIMVLYGFMKQDGRIANSYIKGFDITVKMSLVWSIAQIILFYGVHIDLNKIVFGEILGVEGTVSTYENGNFYPSGFYSHRAILMPLLIYEYYRTKSIIEKCLIVFIALMSKSTALILSITICVVFELIYKQLQFSKLIKKKTKIRNIMVAIGVAFILLIAAIKFGNEINSVFNYVILRISDATSNKADNSSVTHFLYYVNFISILKKMNVVNFLFGYGFGTSGYQYVLLNGQYKDIASWVVESDYINIFLNQGLIGTALFCIPLYKLFKLARAEKKYEYIFFVLTILFAGILYNIQFVWFILLEFSIYIALKNNIEVFSWKEHRVNNDLYYNTQNI